ncbi:MAG TPA: hypothetical protein VF532_00125 [Candidatus Angelobacter sp.]
MLLKFPRLLAVASLCFISIAGASAQQLNVNQTAGFGKDQLLTFTYGQNFSCIHQPFDDLDNNGKVAAVDPAEFQRPRCIVGTQPKIGPTGEPIKEVVKLYVIAPFFETNPGEPAFTPDLGAALKQLFGFVPDAFKNHPGVAVQCPEPGPPATAQTGAPGTCTMHTSLIDLGPVLSQLGLVPKGTAVVTPTINHSHIIDQELHTDAIWWQVVSVLVTDPSAWPSADGRSGITSLDKLRQAQGRKQASADLPTNFFLFFGSDVSQHH